MEKAINQILLDDNVGGKGRFFRTRFLQAGLVKYSFGVCLLEKETIDKFVYDFTGCPVIINHKDVTNESAKDDRVGVISRVEYNTCDGWYWAEGIIFEQEALDLIDKGYNVSCQYEITEYSSNGGIHNGNNYDKVILNGKPEHIAIVKNPRYESALISVNSIDLEAKNGGEGSGIKGHTTPKKDGFKNYTYNVLDRCNLNAGVENFEISKSGYAVRFTIPSENIKNKEKQLEKIINKDNKIEKFSIGSSINGKTIIIIQYKKPIAKNDIIQAINELKENNMFMNLFKKKEKNMDREEMKAIFMECLTELTASNEAKMEEDKKVEEEAKNEEAPKEEPKKDEDGVEDKEKAEVEVEAENKCAKNEIEAQKEMILSTVVENKINYITESKARELGKELF